MNFISRKIFNAKRIAVSALQSATQSNMLNAFPTQVLAASKSGTQFVVREIAQRGLVSLPEMRSGLTSAATKTRELISREYLHNPKLRVFLPLAGIALAATLLTLNASRASAKSTSRDAAQFTQADAPDPPRVIARAEADFDNDEPGRDETAWGRLVADAMKSAAGADVALINAGSLAPGRLQKGDVTGTDLDALLAYPDDAIVTRKISGSQLRAALELALKDAPNDSPRFLHVSGITASYDSQAAQGRLRDVKVNGRTLQNNEVLTVAMPAGLSQGAGGFFTIWGRDDKAARSGALNEILVRHAAKRARLTPDTTARIVAR